MTTNIAAGAVARITREIAAAQKNDDLSIAVAYRDENVRNVRALIIGPPETPYEFGFFEFDMKFTHHYPIKSPQVKCITTNSGRCRFNPNIYADGKVCLSILGTWRGNPGEEWSSAQGLESVLLSIQSLMSPNPYENEPGFEHIKREDPQPRAYIAKIRHESLRISVLQRLEALLGIRNEKSETPKKRQKTAEAQEVEPESPPTPPSAATASSPSTPATEVAAYEYDADAALNAYELSQWDPFADLMKQRFLWYYDSYMRTIESFHGEQSDGAAFKRMEFEYPPNSMEGKFEYTSLRKRLHAVRDKLIEEPRQWSEDGATQVLRQTQLATQLEFQFRQLKQKWNDARSTGSKMEISLPVKDNPFQWHICFFGEPMTHLDGGIWNIKMHIPPNFPNSQPRVMFETPIFHHRVSSTGILCYFPQKEDELGSHLDAVFASIEDKKPAYDPRTMVNPDAFVLYWGGDSKRKAYNRRLRRSAQDSSELL